MSDSTLAELAGYALATFLMLVFWPTVQWYEILGGNIVAFCFLRILSLLMYRKLFP